MKRLALFTIVVIAIMFMFNSCQKEEKFDNLMIVYHVDNTNFNDTLIIFDNGQKFIYVYTDMFSKIKVLRPSQSVQYIILPMFGAIIKDTSNIEEQSIFMNVEDSLKKGIFKEVGKEKVLGKECKIYQGKAGKYWIWKNIPLKQEFEVEQYGQKQLFVRYAVEIKELSVDTAKLFELPKDYKIFSKQEFETFIQQQFKDILTDTTTGNFFSEDTTGLGD